MLDLRCGRGSSLIDLHVLEVTHATLKNMKHALAVAPSSLPNPSPFSSLPQGPFFDVFLTILDNYESVRANPVLKCIIKSVLLADFSPKIEYLYLILSINSLHLRFLNIVQ